MKHPLIPDGLVATRAHDTDSLDCWCGPEFLVACRDHEFDDRCWKCEERNGLLPISRDEADVTDEPVVIVHAGEP